MSTLKSAGIPTSDYAKSTGIDGNYPGAISIDPESVMRVRGKADEDAKAAGVEPVVVGGRYDSSARSISSGNVGAIALTSAGHVITSTTISSAAVIALTTAGHVLVDGSGVTQPISALSLPLPSDAAIASKQPALGTAGTASADVISVQGVASMTPVAISTSTALQTQHQWTQTKSTIMNAVSVTDGNTTTYELAIPAETTKVTLFLDDDQSSNTFSFYLRHATSGSDHSSLSLSDHTMTSQYEVEIIQDLDAVPYLQIVYTNNSGVTATVSCVAVYNEYT
jgi:hypothetical protein